MRFDSAWTGLPGGAPVLGPLYEDDAAITFAELARDVIGGYRPPSPYLASAVAPTGLPGPPSAAFGSSP